MSGPEKSRHFIQTALDAGGREEDEGVNRGFVARSLERSGGDGRDANGTGGGVPLGTPLDVGLAGTFGASTCLLGPAKEDCRILSRAAVEGGGGGSFLCGGLALSTFVELTDCPDRSPDGLRGGSLGAGRSLSLDSSFDSLRGGSGGTDNEAGLGGAGDFPLLGGRGGSSASPHAGARSRFTPVSPDDVDRVPEPFPVLVDDVECDVPDVVDSRDSLCSSCTDGLRGGRAGGG